ncbi:ABC transporter substrate-binding protein [Labrys wisconsinensis]|uniref:Peptide/nickel transport system substrate-binding protein n=1 Tax=Labrys wisconsinensis TaxID=425677 RepID=A0ABU0IYF5_9HYPH|nr:ABC transporter substrate-binding protein [Labrys wisconsinensis]MDQ0467046.1 peptide/nickel transport system substrate-binding protein [Labrys wisconsinensis]
MSMLVRLGLSAAVGLCLLALPVRADGPKFIEPPSLAKDVAAGKLEPVAQRLPKTPLVSDMLDRKRTIGRYGGQLRMLAAKARDLRYVTVNGYTRLVTYDENLNLKPDVLEKFDNEGDRVFTFTLREGHRWSDGAPFTTEDFRYYWEDIANNRELSPSGPPDLFIAGGKLPKVEILDARHIRYSWDTPNPRFLPSLALPRPIFIYSPAHYLRKFHARYADPKQLAALVAKKKATSWAALHNKLEDPYEASNVDMPVLDPWYVVTKAPAQRFVFERNPYFHRVDPEGHQLPYIDRVVVDIASAGLFAAKANAGEVDLQARGLSMADVPVLKEGEAGHKYRTLLWPIARGSAFALYPNLTTNDPVWRKLLRDVRFRRALSLGIDRHTLNNALWFGLGIEGNDTVMPESALYQPDFRTAWADFDPERANAMLDDIGLAKRDLSGTRLLPDGRPLEILVEVAGDAADLIDALQITAEFWADIGVELVIKPQDASNLRQRSFAGETVMVASQGLDNALPTALMSPGELALTRQDNFAWPKWGQYFETGGRVGEAPDMPEAKQLMDLYDQWLTSSDLSAKAHAWTEMLRLHAENQWVIGTVAGSIQPVVVAEHLKNVPAKAVFSWEPTAMLGAYHIDEFYFDDQSDQSASQ